VPVGSFLKWEGRQSWATEKLATHIPITNQPFDGEKGDRQKRKSKRHCSKEVRTCSSGIHNKEEIPEIRTLARASGEARSGGREGSGEGEGGSGGFF